MESARSTSPRATGVPTIFIVDDDESLRRSLARLVRAVGLNAESFESARAFIEREPFTGAGCILLDVQMPGVSGPELHAELLERHVALPVVFLTAHGDLPTGIAAISFAIDSLVGKLPGQIINQSQNYTSLRGNAGELIELVV